MTESVSIRRRGYVSVGSVQIHFRESGLTARPPVALFHQSPSSSAMYAPIQDRLASQFHVVAFDSPGYGNSDPVDPPSVEAWADVLAKAMGRLRPSPWNVFGHHTGALIALAIADGRADVCSIVLSGPPALASADRQRVLDASRWLPPVQDGSHLLGWWRRWRQLSPSVPLDIIDREVAASLAPGSHAGYAAACAFDAVSVARRMTLPVAVIGGADDPLLHCFAAIADSMHAGHVHVVDGAGVHLCETHPDLVVKVMLDVMAGGR